MPYVIDFHSINEIFKPLTSRVYHNDSECPDGRNIPQGERRPGTDGYPLCTICRKLNEQLR